MEQINAESSDSTCTIIFFPTFRFLIFPLFKKSCRTLLKLFVIVWLIQLLNYLIIFYGNLHFLLWETRSKKLTDTFDTF